jgi:steroid delta-isomerase-like uncharacterized protein
MSDVDVCIRTQQELFGAGRIDLAEELLTEDCIDHGGEVGPGPGQPARGREAIAGVVQWLRGAFPDLSYKVDDAFGNGDRVAIRCTVSGTHEGEFLGRPASGRRFAVQQIHVFRMEDGRIAEHWACRDDAGMMGQLGFLG